MKVCDSVQDIVARVIGHFVKLWYSSALTALKRKAPPVRPTPRGSLKRDVNDSFANYEGIVQKAEGIVNTKKAPPVRPTPRGAV